MNLIDPAKGPSPPSTATVTASQNGMIRWRAAQMHTSDIAIHSTPWDSPSTNVHGSGLPRTNAHTSSASRPLNG